MARAAAAFHLPGAHVVFTCGMVGATAQASNEPALETSNAPDPGGAQEGVSMELLLMSSVVAAMLAAIAMYTRQAHNAAITKSRSWSCCRALSAVLAAGLGAAATLVALAVAYGNLEPRAMIATWFEHVDAQPHLNPFPSSASVPGDLLPSDLRHGHMNRRVMMMTRCRPGNLHLRSNHHAPRSPVTARRTAAAFGTAPTTSCTMSPCAHEPPYCSQCTSYRRCTLPCAGMPSSCAKRECVNYSTASSKAYGMRAARRSRSRANYARRTETAHYHAP